MSRVRHVIGAATRRSYRGLSITRSVQDNQFCAVNPRFIAVVTECTGGGAFIIISVHHAGRVNPLHPRVCGHRARVLDVKWDPFNDLRIASCSDDCTVKVWDIPQDGLRNNITVPSKVLLAHTRRVGLIEWHPTARDLLLSSAYDYKVFVWCLDTLDWVVERPVCEIDAHAHLVTCLSLNHDGSLLATTCKDKKIRIIEPRAGRVLQEFSSKTHKACKILFLSNLNMLLSTGHSDWNHRQITLWDLEDLSVLLEEDLDRDSGVIFPFYDPDTHMLYLAGKGDGNIRYYEVSAEKPYIHFMGEFRSPFPQRGLGVMPKRGLNISVCEVFRFYRLVGVTDLLEPVSFCVLQKFKGFNEDIHPMTAANTPALTAHEWLTGQNKGPVMMSLRPAAEGHRSESPDASFGLKHEELTNLHMECPCDIITDMHDWTEDDTQSHDWNSSRTGADLNRTDRTSPPAAERELLQLLHHQQEEIKELQEKLRQRDDKIQQLQLEIRNARKHMRASF